jgi:hypothetical protein
LKRAGEHDRCRRNQEFLDAHHNHPHGRAANLCWDVSLQPFLVQHYPHAATWVTWGFVAAWLAATVFNLSVGVSHAAHSLREELPVLLLLFVVPAAVALLVRWKFA